jgi:hypothetical protein
MPTADKGLLTLIYKELAPVMQRTISNAQLAPLAPEICHSCALVARLPV